MNKLSERFMYYCGLFSMFINNQNVKVDDFAHIQDLINAEELGLLIKLKCKVGDVVWDNDYGKPCAYTITGFSYGEADSYIDEPVATEDIVYYYSNSNGSITGSFASNEIGKSVFLSLEDAEQVLKESK